MIAGEVIYVPAAELQRAGLAPSDFTVMAPPESGRRWPSERAAHDRARAAAGHGPPARLRLGIDTGDRARRRSSRLLPAGRWRRWRASTCRARASRPSCWAIGFCLVMLGVITNPIILVVGLLWMLAGAVGWIRIGLLEDRAAAAHAAAAGSTTELKRCAWRTGRARWPGCGAGGMSAGSRRRWTTSARRPTSRSPTRTGPRSVRRSLAGHVTLLDFIYTHCTDACPLLSATFPADDAQARRRETARVAR